MGLNSTLFSFLEKKINPMRIKENIFFYDLTIERLSDHLNSDEYLKKLLSYDSVDDLKAKELIKTQNNNLQKYIQAESKFVHSSVKKNVSNKYNECVNILADFYSETFDPVQLKETIAILGIDIKKALDYLNSQEYFNRLLSYDRVDSARATKIIELQNANILKYIQSIS